MMVGRKRVALVDADGVWLAINTVPASVQERDTLPALDGGSTHWPSLRLAIFDGGFTADRCREWANFHGMRHHVVSREPGQKGFVVLPRPLGGRTQLWVACALGRPAARPRRTAGCLNRASRLRRHSVWCSGTAQSNANPCRLTMSVCL